MSWGTVTVSSVALADLDQGLAGAKQCYLDQLTENDYKLDTEALEQVDAGIAAAKALADSGAFGAGPYNVSLSGHANPNHEPHAGWANDFISVSFTSAATSAPAAEQKPAETPVEEPAEAPVDPGPTHSAGL